MLNRNHTFLTQLIFSFVVRWWASLRPTDKLIELYCWLEKTEIIQFTQLGDRWLDSWKCMVMNHEQLLPILVRECCMVATGLLNRIKILSYDQTQALIPFLLHDCFTVTNVLHGNSSKFMLKYHCSGICVNWFLWRGAELQRRNIIMVNMGWKNYWKPYGTRGIPLPKLQMMQFEMHQQENKDNEYLLCMLY